MYKVTSRDLKERWHKTQEIYKEICNDITFKTYKNTGHEYTDDIIREIKQFLEKK